MPMRLPDAAGTFSLPTSALAMLMLFLSGTAAQSTLETVNAGPGVICAGWNETSENALEELHGKNLVVGASDLLEGISFDATQVGNARFSGLDIDILARLATDLGFTYTLTRVLKVSDNETWTELAERVTPQVDLLLGWWYSNAYRMNTFLMMNPFIDNSPILVTKKAEVERVRLFDTMFTFTQPFTPGLWGLIFLEIILVGLLIYRVEQPKRSEDLFHNVAFNMADKFKMAAAKVREKASILPFLASEVSD